MTSLKPTNIEAAKAIQWPRHLRTPTELMNDLKHQTKLHLIRSPIYSKIILQIVGSWAYLLAHVLNKSKVINIETFNEELKRIETQLESRRKNPSAFENSNKSHPAPLLTFSNHISCIDDPILWGSLLPLTYYSRKTDSVRWSAAAIEICFSKPWHSTFFSLGKTFPIIRGAGVDQPGMDFAAGLLNHSQWLHLFPEGRVMRDDKQQKISNRDKGYIFKWGISKLILDYFKSTNSERTLKLLPFYHLGLDKILPIGWPYIPRCGKQITIYVRPSVIDLNVKLLNDILKKQTISVQSSIKSRSNDVVNRIKLTCYLEEEMERLVEHATKFHQDN